MITRLAIVSTITGMVLLTTGTPGLVTPLNWRVQALRFPRSVLWGRILIGIVALISMVVAWHAAADEEWSPYRPLIVIGFPIACWLVIQYGNQFLSMRALAALMLMAAKQMVDAADLSDLPIRLFVTVLAYLWVVAAMWMTMAPHHWRDVIGFLMANDRRCRLTCAGGVLLGVALVCLGLFVY